MKCLKDEDCHVLIWRTSLVFVVPCIKLELQRVDIFHYKKLE